ncbi:riboflavin-aldehyde forming enzyme [Agrocybe pediades]|nr:riboflavin-aldehyde forming enzyme [Agrocybe pediades]
MKFFLKPNVFATIALTALVSAAQASFVGDATWFNTGLGSCGFNNVDSDFVVALNSAQAAGNAHCGQLIRVQFQATTILVQVVDTCPGCGVNGIDLSPGAFQALAPLDVGRIQVTWDFV